MGYTQYHLVRRQSGKNGSLTVKHSNLNGYRLRDGKGPLRSTLLAGTDVTSRIRRTGGALDALIRQANYLWRADLTYWIAAAGEVCIGCTTGRQRLVCEQCGSRGKVVTDCCCVRGRGKCVVYSLCAWKPADSTQCIV